jgi:hypothetical protein
LLVVVALVVAAPALRSEPSDGFPLSSYPMFSSDRGRVAAVATAVGIDADGTAHRLGPHAIGGGDEAMLAASAVRRAAAAGGAETARFCEEVAARVAGDGRTDLRAVQIRTEVRDAVADVEAEDAPLDVVVHATCALP